MHEIKIKVNQLKLLYPYCACHTIIPNLLVYLLVNFLIIINGEPHACLLTF